MISLTSNEVGFFNDKEEYKENKKKWMGTDVVN